MRYRSQAVATVMMAGTLVVLLPTPAQAATYCVGDPVCEGGTPMATLAAAVAAADASPGPDTVLIAPGVYETPLQACNGLFVTEADTWVRGSGIGSTVLTTPDLPGDAGYTRSVICGHMHLSDLTLRLASAVTTGNASLQGFDLYSGRIERVRIDAVGATFGPGSNDGRGEAGLVREGIVRDLEVDLDPDQDTEGLNFLNSGPVLMERIRVRSRVRALGGRVAQAPGIAPTVVRHARLESSYPMRVSSNSGHDGELRLSDAVVICRTTDVCTGVGVADGIPSQAATLTMDRVTIIGNGHSGSAALEVYGQGGAAPTTLHARHVVAHGFPTTLHLGHFGGPASAYISHSNLDLSPGRVIIEGASSPGAVTSFGPGNRAGAPRLRNPAGGDYRLTSTSPGVDIGGADLIQGGPTDLAGTRRPLDGNGDGSAVNDAGAFEHRRPAPRIKVVGVKRRPSAGTAVLVVRVSDAGRVVLRGKQVRKSVTGASRPKKVRLTVRARGQALEQLRSTGSVRIRPVVRLLPRAEGVKPVQLKPRVRLVLR
ncbi:hypothetical protein [Nocardioides sp.]|uniref:hypothetical protein n=1 Tax=Nocardioides sp. TaxID=35761 RepID=UPI002734B604|nr:hypothetical protein [Nocardioides sp.]MDP3891933.1 hypothetical protein [Nocardioides sp.]